MPRGLLYFAKRNDELKNQDYGSQASVCDKLKERGSYNLEKVLNFSSRLEKSLISVKVLEKYLISLLGLEKSLKFRKLFIPYHFSENQMILPGKFCALTSNNRR